MIPTELLLKLLLYVGGPALVLLLTYFKGYFSGKGSEKAAQAEAARELDQKLKGAAAKNATLDWKRDQNINAVIRPKSSADILAEWNKRWGGGKSGHEND